MPESVADKTPMPITIRRHHIDPPGLWIAIVIGSVVLHSLLLWLMFTSKLNLVGRRSNAATPIKIVEVVPTIKAKAKPRVIAQKPKIEPKVESKPIQIKPEPVPAQPVTKQKPGTITFTNKTFVRKPVNKSPLVKKQRSLPAVKPKLEPKVAIIPPKPVKTEPKKPNLAEQRRLQRLEEQRRLDRLVQQQRTQELAQQQRFEKLEQQQRARDIAEQRRLDRLVQQQRTQELAQQQRFEKLAQQQRAKEIAEQRRLDRLVQQQRTQELAQQQRSEKLAQQQRAREIAEQRRLDRLAQQQRTEATNEQQQRVPVGGINQEKVPLGKATPLPAYTPTLTPTPTPKPTSAPATTTANNTEGQGGFLEANVVSIDEEAQKGLNSGATDILEVYPRLAETAKTPKKLPVLNENDKKLVTTTKRCLVRLFINGNGNIDEPGKGSSGIKATGEPGTGDLCQRYVTQYFALNKDMKFIPGKDVGGIDSPGYMLMYIEIKAPEKKNPS